MKTIITFEPVSKSTENSQFLKLIEEQPETGHKLTIEDLKGYINVRSAMFPALPLTFVQYENELNVYERDKIVAILKWKEVYELNENELNESFPLSDHILNLTNKLS